MPISVVVGGQFGSEGKGKLCHWLAKQQGAKYAVRVGGPNSGHTAVSNDTTFVLRQLPTPCLWGDITSVIPAGAYLNADILSREVSATNLSPDRLMIHPYAVLIDDRMRNEEAQSNLSERISSTCQGVGAAVSHRASRDSSVRFAKDHSSLGRFIDERVENILARGLRNNDRVIVEGTQGFGLSVLHGGYYPFATSRDTSAAGALSEAGLSPIDVDCIALVIRSYPIRVAGNSGPLPNETSWESVTKSSGAREGLSESTTVTGKVRRIAHFDGSVVKDAIAVNNPTHICLNHVDYLDFSVHEKWSINGSVFDRIAEIETLISRSISWIGTGPSTTFEKPTSSRMSAAAA